MNDNGETCEHRGVLDRDDAGRFCLQPWLGGQQLTGIEVPIVEILEEFLGQRVLLDLFGEKFDGTLSDGGRSQFYLLSHIGSHDPLIEIYRILECHLGSPVSMIVQLDHANVASAAGDDVGDAGKKLEYSDPVVRIRLEEINTLNRDLAHHVVIFSQGDLDYHTFRIPGLLVCPGNIVLAFAEARKFGTSDFGEIHCAMRRSLDGGLTWEPPRIIMEKGPLAVQNPCPVFVPETGEIVLLLLVDRKYPHVMRSGDLGKTWGEPAPLENLFVEGWAVNGPCPGHAIRLSSGRLLACCHHNQGERVENGRVVNGGTWNTHLIYSDDDGRTWKRGHVFHAGTNEAMAVETRDGRVLIIMRQNQENEDPGRILGAWSDDGGITATDPKPLADLRGPVCQASIARARDGLLLFSNPDSERRENMTVRASLDAGNTWPLRRLIYNGPSAYSDLAILEDGIACCAFERGTSYPVDEILFTWLGLDWFQP